MATATSAPPETLRTLPSDAVRQIQWRFADRYDLQMLIQSVRAVARGPVAQLVAAGGRNSHEWTEQKNELLEHFDRSGITAVFMEPEQGGFIAGPKNLALALVAFELALGGWRRGNRKSGGMPGAGTDSRARHFRATRSLYAARRSCAAGRRSQSLAWSVLPDGADSLCWRRYRNAERQAQRGEVGGGRRAGAACRKARALHHKYWISRTS